MNRLRALFASKLGLFASIGLVAAFAVTGCRGGSADAPAGGGAAGGRGGRGGRGAGGGAQPVVVARVTQKDVPIDIAAVGNVEAYTTIAVRSQVTGNLDKVAVHEGDFVKIGDLLFSIDERPLQSALEQAQANLVRDQALLAQAEAQLARDAANAEYQQLTAERQSQLVKQGIISKDVAEQARSQADATAATVKADKAAVSSAQAQMDVQKAAVDAAKVQLGYCVIRSPINGRLGDVTVKAGNLVTANNTQLMTISQVEPVFVTFAVPATYLPTIKAHSSGREKLSVVATPQDAEAMPVEGQLTFLDSVVDSTTDTIKLKATFTNADHRLWPGQFARVSLRLTTLEAATVVPQQAVQTGQDGQFVFVVSQGGARGGRGGRGRGQGQGAGGDQAAAPAQGQTPPAQGQPAAAAGGGDAAAAAPALTVEQRPVTVAQRVGDDIVIEKGLRPGETVVTEGQLRLEQGTRVQISDPNGNTQAGRGGRGGRGRGQGQGGGGADQGGQAGQGGQQAGQGGQGGQRGEAAQGGQGQGGRNGQ
jgi:multidrug efflux system membrane fusion protein